MSLMTSPFRPLLSSLLCCVIASGQLPALLHVATCHGHAQSAHVESEQVSAGSCSHACHHHSTDLTAESAGESSTVADFQESQPLPDHDSDHCAVCHSLANPVGFAWSMELPITQECLFEPASICADRLPVEASFTIPQPRGPPTLS